MVHPPPRVVSTRPCRWKEEVGREELLGTPRLACVFAIASWSVASLTHKELVHRSVAAQWPFLVQFVCFSFDISGASHATHSEPSRLTSWFGGSPAHNKSHGQRRTFVHNARGVWGTDRHT